MNWVNYVNRENMEIGLSRCVDFDLNGLYKNSDASQCFGLRDQGRLIRVQE